MLLIGSLGHWVLLIGNLGHFPLNFFVKFGLKTAWGISYDILLSLFEICQLWQLQGCLSILAKIGATYLTSFWQLDIFTHYLNHLIVEWVSAPYWQFGTLSIEFFCQIWTQDSLRHLLWQLSLLKFANFWWLQAVRVFWPKLGVFRKSKFSWWRRNEAGCDLGVLGWQITRLYDGTILGGGGCVTHLRGSFRLLKKTETEKLHFSGHLWWLKGYSAFTDFIKNQSIDVT